MKIEELKSNQEFLSKKLIKKFVKKHGYEFNFWVGDNPTSVACFVDQYYFSLEEIYYDIVNKIEKNKIFEWQDYLVKNHKTTLERDYKISFENYVKGDRYEMEVVSTTEVQVEKQDETKPELKFSLDASQLEKLEKWKKSLKKTKLATIGGAYSYVFTPTGLGTIAEVKRFDGQTIDLTDIENW